MDNPTENAQLKDPDHNLEIGSDEPNLELIMSELEQAETDSNRYYGRNCQAYDYWHCRWDGQSIDGCKHPMRDEDESPFPWDGAADGRLRLVDGQIREHLTVAMFAFKKAKIQAVSLHPLTNARQGHQATQLLTWMVNTHMRDNLQREIPLALASMFGYGASIIAVEWEQERRLEEIEIKLEDLAAMGQQQGQGGAQSSQMGVQLMDAILDPEQEDAMTSLIQQMSPILTKTVARKVIRDLREKHVAIIPSPYIINSRPRLTALRIGVDILFPDMTDDLQAARWMSQRERVTETELKDRIETENYDPAFVAEALKTKGQTSDRFRFYFGEDEQPKGDEQYNSRSSTDNSYRDLIELHHFRKKAIEYGTPALYKTVFCPSTLRKKSGKFLYATHGLDPYKHGLYPYVDLRFERFERSITSSRGIPEIMYTRSEERRVGKE